MRTIAVYNAKGGVGKSTTVVNLSYGLSLQGCKVLAIDLDSQCNTTEAFVVEDENRLSLTEVLLDGKDINSAIMKLSDTFSLLPASVYLANAETELASQPGRDTALKVSMEQMDEEYDYCVLDFPSNVGVLAVNGLCVSTDVIIPIQAHYYALRSIKTMIDLIQITQKRLNPKLSILGALCTFVDFRKNLCRDSVDQVKSFFGNVMFDTMIRENVRLAEAPSRTMNIFQHDPKSMGAEDYMLLSKEVIERTGVLNDVK